MKILYVSSVWSGIKPLLFEGRDVPEGMPAFFNVLKRLFERGHHVDFVFYGGKPADLNIGPEWLRNSRIEQVERPRGIYWPWKLKRPLKSVVRQVIAEEQPDFIYLQGFSASKVASMCRSLGLPFGQRVYGVRGLDEKFSQYTGVWLRAKYGWELEAFTGRKDFLIVTRDGSRGDKVYRTLQARSNVPMYFSLNGVSKKHVESTSDNGVPEGCPFIFYPSRFAKRKCNDLAVDFLKRLHESGLNQFHLVLAGQENDASVVAKTRKKVADYNLQKFVTFAGVLDADQMQEYYARCAAVASFYTVANLGNITLEALSYGCVFVSYVDESLDGVVVDGVNGLLGRDVDEAANKFSAVFRETSAYDTLCESARVHADRLLPSWQARADWEIDLIEAAVAGRAQPACPAYAQLMLPGAASE